MRGLDEWRGRVWGKVDCGVWWMNVGIVGELRFVGRRRVAQLELQKVAFVVREVVWVHGCW